MEYFLFVQVSQKESSWLDAGWTQVWRTEPSAESLSPAVPIPTTLAASLRSNRQKQKSLTCRTFCMWSFRVLAGPNLTGYLSVGGGLQYTSTSVFLTATLMAGLQKQRALFLETERKMQAVPCPPLLWTLKWPYCIQQLAYCSVLKDPLFQWKKKKSHSCYLFLW